MKNKKRPVHNINYHITWIPKYRRSFIKGKIKQYVEEAIISKSKELDIKLEIYKIMDDHIHLFIRCSTTQNVSDIVRQLKGYSSYYTRRKLVNLQRFKALWAPGFFCETIGFISEPIILKYIENQ